MEREVATAGRRNRECLSFGTIEVRTIINALRSANSITSTLWSMTSFAFKISPGIRNAGRIIRSKYFIAKVNTGEID